MRARHLTAVAATAVSLLIAAAPAASAAPSAAAVPWSVEYGTAVAAGERWTEGAGIFPDLVVRGQLSDASNDCYSVWTRVTRDLAPGLPFKQAEVCGGGRAPVDFVVPTYMPTTTVHLTVCRGTESPTDCAPYQTLTSWPAAG